MPRWVYSNFELFSEHHFCPCLRVSTGTPCFTELTFIVLHRCSSFYKLEARASTSKKIRTHFIAVVWNPTCNTSEVYLHRKSGFTGWQDQTQVLPIVEVLYVDWNYWSTKIKSFGGGHQKEAAEFQGKKWRVLTINRHCEAIKAAFRIHLDVCVKSNKRKPVYPPSSLKNKTQSTLTTNRDGFSNGRRRLAAEPPAGPSKERCQKMNHFPWSGAGGSPNQPPRTGIAPGAP